MMDLEKRKREINERLDWMDDNYEGCDWCCGGGDDEREDLLKELKELEAKGGD